MTLQSPDGPSVFTYSATVGYTLNLLYLPGFGDYPILGQVLQLLWQGAHGDAAISAAVVPRAGGLGGYDNETDAQVAITCTDTDNPRDPFYVARQAAASQHIVPDFGPAWAYLSLSCPSWPARAADRYTGPWSPRTSAPVLIIGNTHDAALPYANAVKVAGLLPRSRLLTLDAVGHTSWFSEPSTCIQDATAAYWISGRLPAPGTVCQPDQGPFDPTASAPSSARQRFAASA